MVGTSQRSMKRAVSVATSAFLRLAVANNWIPDGVKIYGEGGNA